MKKQHLHRMALLGSVAALACCAPWAASGQTLTHRYSFNDSAGNATFADSVGSANGALVGTAYLDGSGLVLDGLGSYGELPAGLVNGYSAITVELWADFGQNPVWTRVFSFGSQNPDDGSKASGLDYCHYAGGNYQNLDLRATSGADVYANNPSGLNNTTNVHITVVADPANNQLYYYNGTEVISVMHGGPVPDLNSFDDTLNWIGASLYAVDPTLTGTIHEFRIYQGVLSARQVALDDQAGPDTIPTDTGTLQAVHLSSPVPQMFLNSPYQMAFTGDFQNVTGLDLITYGGAAFASDNTNVVTINPTNGLATTLGTGTATVVASYGGLKATNVLTVALQPLAHRYSFTTDASDPAGGANGTLEGNATVSGGKLVLDGSAGTYLDMPGAIINMATNKQVTFDAWVTFGEMPQWSELFTFGNATGGNGQNAITCVPRAGNAAGFRHWGITENFGGGVTPSTPPGWSNITAHITCVVDPLTGTLGIYRDGVLEFAEYDAVSPLSKVETNYAYLGRSLYDADPYADMSVDEFRIYGGALTPQQVALINAAGPDSTSLDVGALSSITVAATNYPAFSRVPPVVLANFANLPNFNLLPNLTARAQGLVVTSSDSSVISVGADNMLITAGPGTATLTATYRGQTSSATVTVKELAVLTHRYSFTTDATDSVGGANGTLVGAATISGGQLQLTGSNDDYLELPPALLKDYDSATIDVWVNLGEAQHWARLWEFVDVGTGAANEFFLAPGWNAGPDAHTYGADFGSGSGNITLPGAFGNQMLHLTFAYGDGTMDIYTNGVLEVTQSRTSPLRAGTLSSTIGHSPFADPGINGSVDEFRIYRGKVSPQQVLEADSLGPDVIPSARPTLTATSSGGNIVLSWPADATGYSVQMNTSLSNANGWTDLSTTPTQVGDQWQVSVPENQTAQFFRLKK